MLDVLGASAAGGRLEVGDDAGRGSSAPRLRPRAAAGRGRRPRASCGRRGRSRPCARSRRAARACTRRSPPGTARGLLDGRVVGREARIEVPRAAVLADHDARVLHGAVGKQQLRADRGRLRVRVGVVHQRVEPVRDAARCRCSGRRAALRAPRPRRRCRRPRSPRSRSRRSERTAVGLARRAAPACRPWRRRPRRRSRTACAGGSARIASRQRRVSPARPCTGITIVQRGSLTGRAR